LRLKYELPGRMIITSPSKSMEFNFKLSGNYYISIILKGNVVELCFPLCSQSRLVCFRIRNFIGEPDFSDDGFIKNYYNDGKTEFIIPPERSGFYISRKVPDRMKVEAYSKLFWEIEEDVRTMMNGWSGKSSYYCRIGNTMPSIGFHEGENGTFVAIGDTPDRAILNAIHLARTGKDLLRKEAVDFLSRFSSLDTKLMIDNSLLAIFFSNSACIDEERNCILASKSPKYYVSGGFWARDFIFWTLPLIERFDPSRAKKLIGELLESYWKNKGIHALYIDGRILYEGFELDQLAYYFIALEKGITYGLITPLEARSMGKEILDILEGYRSDRYHLYRTELDSSDDPVEYPYVTFDNVVLWYGIKTLGIKISEFSDDEFLKTATAIKRDIMHNMVKDGEFCYSTDLDGNYEFYDNPTGSLVLLPYLKFVEKRDDAFIKTLRRIRSKENRYWIDGEYPGAGNRHVNHPWIHYYASEIIAGFRDPSFVSHIEMDSGLACETIDEKTGLCLTGIHFPGASAFLVSSILNSKSQKHGVRKGQR